MNLAKPEGVRLDMAAAERLAQYLREHPERANRSPDSLAEEFGLPVEFVDEIIRYLQSGPEGSNAWREALRDFRAKLTVMLRLAADGVEQALKRPIVFLVTVFLSSFALLSLANAMGDGIRIESSPVGPEISAGNLAMLTLVAFLAAHLSCYYHHGTVRLALKGTAITGLLALAALVLQGGGVQLFSSPAQRFTSLAMLIGCAELTVLYGLLAVGCAIIGSASRLNLDETSLNGHSRQQLLERLLILRERLDSIDTAHQPTTSNERGLRRWFCRTPYCATLILSLSAGLLRIVLHGLALNLGTASAVYRDAVEALMAVAITALMVPMAYLAGSVRRGLVSALLAVTAVQIAEWIPIGDFGWRPYWPHFSWDRITFLYACAAVLGVVAGLAAKVEERRAQDQKLLDRDPAAMVAEWIRIHWRISPHRTNVTVMVVDVKSSSRMKAEADPLVAEYCFREYQKFLAQISARWGGAVHATSGDGAVIAFSSPNEAFAAARAIQHELEGFNRNINRLPQNFRLRIGLHMGQVQGELDEVEFTEVIDIAAHVEAAAPVGDIAMTSLVAQTLEGVRLAEMAEPVDGWPIFLARNPTGD